MTIQTDQRTEQTHHDPWFWEGRGIPIQEILAVVASIPYAHPIRIGLQLLFYTGCRISELAKMQQSDLLDGVIYWRMGKNQTGKEHRKERLPQALLVELQTYWKTHRMPYNRIFHLTGESLVRRFNAEIRPKLPAQWHVTLPTRRRNGFVWEYALQIKGLRKVFATLVFAHYHAKFNDAFVAGEMTSRRMHHSSTGMTYHHYILCSEQIQATQYLHLMPFEITTQQSQSVLMEWGC